MADENSVLAWLKPISRRLGTRRVLDTAVVVAGRECTLRINKARRELGYVPQLTPAQAMAQMPKLPLP